MESDRTDQAGVVMTTPLERKSRRLTGMDCAPVYDDRAEVKDAHGEAGHRRESREVD